MKKYGFMAAVIAGASLSTILIFFIPYLSPGERSVGVIENIDGIPFPRAEQTTLITEKLAHTDIFLTEPVFAQQLKLTITFRPGNSTELYVGVRENPFWLSYQKYELFKSTTNNAARSSLITKVVSIPLTDKIQEKDRSIDILFFATNNNSRSEIDEYEHDATSWQLEDITAEVHASHPSLAETKDYIRSILKRERPL